MIVDAVKDACRALLLWDRRRIAVAVAAAAVSAVVIGVATVLIPNSLFARDIPPVWWDYPVWILTAVLIGMLIASYVRGPDVEAERRSGVLGGAGGILGWFAVGCPVCNKIALLALGYTGALTYFAPLQPILAALSIVLLVVAVIIRLKGQYACPVPSSERSVRS